MLGIFGKWRARSRVNRRLSWVAEVIAQDEEFEGRVAVVAGELSGGELLVLTTLLLSEVKAPRALADKFRDYGSWLAARRTAAYEIFAKAGERGVNALLVLLRGPEELDQGFALDLLGHLAGLGIRKDELVGELSRNLTDWSSDTVMDGADGLAQLAGESPAFAVAMLGLVDEWAAGERLDYLDLLESLASEAPQVARSRTTLLLDIMRTKGRGPSRTTWPDGVTAPDKPDVEPFDLDSLRAAMTLHELDPANAEVNEALRRWMHEHPDPSIRDEIAGLLADLGRD